VPAAWGPNVNVAYSTFNDAFGRAARNRSGFSGALTEMQQAAVNDLRDHGFQVTE
jgi:multiple sugar transport system substrate-binding protein